jgi:hypothetical protein
LEGIVKPPALFLSLACLLAISAPARGDAGTAACGPNDDYVTLYYSLETYEMAARVPCGAKLAVLDDQRSYAAQRAPYVRVQTADGKVGYVTRNAIAIVEAPVPPASAPNSAPSSAPSASVPPAATKSAGRRSLALAGAPIPAGAPAPSTPTVPVAQPVSASAHLPSEVRVPDGTELEVKLSADLSSERITEGAAVEFTVTQPLVSNGVTVFAAGATAHARVVEVKKAGRFGHDGEIYWKMQDVAASDGSLVPARFSAEAQDSAASGLSVGILAATGNTQLVEQPSFSIHKGEAASLPAGKIFKVLVYGDAIIQTSPALAAISTAHP